MRKVNLPNNQWTQQVNETYPLLNGSTLHISAYHTSYNAPEPTPHAAYTYAVGTLDGVKVHMEANGHGALVVEPAPEEYTTDEEYIRITDQWCSTGIAHVSTRWAKWGRHVIWRETVPQGVRRFVSGSSDRTVAARRRLWQRQNR